MCFGKILVPDNITTDGLSTLSANAWDYFYDNCHKNDHSSFITTIIFLRNAEFGPLVDGSGLKLPYSVNALQCDLTALPSQHLQIGHKKGITIL